jgi:hypothetical protein
MPRFHGTVGYGETVETSPGVYEESIFTRSYFGDVLRNTRKLIQGENLNQEITVVNQISIVADDHARGNFMHIRYVEWEGIPWTITDVEVQLPRLILSLGEVYRGPTAPTP